MKISILSDLHIDFYVVQKDPRRIKAHHVSFLDAYLDRDEDVEVLVVAGDLGHHNAQNIAILKLVAEVYNYKKVYCVLGNHDLYGSSKYGSAKRMEEMFTYVDEDEVLYILNGTIETYKGVKFGGAMLWYDGVYNAPQGYAYRDPISIWKDTMNDARYIKGLGDFYDIFAREKEKLKGLLDVDVCITHINPLAAPMAFPPEYRHETSSMFYAFNGDDYLLESKSKVHVYGHSHGQHSYDIYDTFCVMNTLGYPGELSKRLTLDLSLYHIKEA